LAAAFEIDFRSREFAGIAKVSRLSQPGPRICGLILAAGASRRMGTSKALLTVGGETFLDRLIGLLSVVCEPVIVVMGHDALQSKNGMFVTNPEPERGMLSSLQCGLRAVPAEAEGVLFTPVDHAAVQEETIRKLAAAFQQGGADVVVPAFEQRHGHPVAISRRVVSEILDAPVDATARDLIHRYKAMEIAVEDPGVVMDADDPADYQKLLAIAGKGIA